MWDSKSVCLWTLQAVPFERVSRILVGWGVGCRFRRG